MIVTPCQRCQANVEVYQSEINRKQGTKSAMPVVYYSQLMSVTYGGSAKLAGLNGHVILPKKLQDNSGKQLNYPSPVAVRDLQASYICRMGRYNPAIQNRSIRSGDNATP